MTQTTNIWTPTKDEIREGNKLIARFCGYEYFPSEPGKAAPFTHPYGWRKVKGHIKMGLDYYLCRNHNELRFFNEWSWLYMAIDQIEKESNLFNPVTISTNYVTIFLRTYDVKLYGSKRAAAWNAIVDFIKWRNNLQKSTNEAENFRKEYSRLHAACPKCGDTGYTTTLMGFPLNVDRMEEYKDLNTCTCDNCGDKHTKHERVEVKQ